MTTNLKKTKSRDFIPTYFPKYISKESVQLDLETRDFAKGFLRIDSNFPNMSYVENPLSPDYVITSVVDRNRALEGDEVILYLKTVRADKRLVMQVVHITEKVELRHLNCGKETNYFLFGE
jgi:hypothetical protein